MPHNILTIKNKAWLKAFYTIKRKGIWLHIHVFKKQNYATLMSINRQDCIDFIRKERMNHKKPEKIILAYSREQIKVWGVRLNYYESKIAEEYLSNSSLQVFE